MKAAKEGSVQASRKAAKLEDDLWLVPIEDRREKDSVREGMLPTFTLGNYLLLVEHTGRLVRDKKASISAELADIFERLGTSAELWQARVKRLSGGRLLGRFLGGTKERLAEAAQRLGVSRVANLKATG